MTAPIAGFARAIPEATPSTGDAVGNAAAPAEGTETFGSALATALADEEGRAHAHTGRARREGSASSTRGDDRANAAADESTNKREASAAATTEGAPIAHPGRAIGLTEGEGRGLEHASTRALAVLAALVEGRSGDETASASHGTAGVKPSARPVRSHPGIELPTPAETTVGEATASPSTSGVVADTEQLLDIAFGVAAQIAIDTPAPDEGAEAERSELPADASLAEQFVEAAVGGVVDESIVSESIASAPTVSTGAPGPVAAMPAPALEPTAARETGSVRRSTEALVPEMRIRLERVIERMESEFGYKVEVVESVRSQSRQDELYAQGRSAPGPVVTWTRNSKHIDGRAVDVMIDGSYGNPEAYRDLAKVAQEEGLKSLWPRDGGHLELRGKGADPIPSVARSGIDPRSTTATERPATSALPNALPTMPQLPPLPTSPADVALPFGATPRDGGAPAAQDGQRRESALPLGPSRAAGAQAPDAAASDRRGAGRGLARVADVAPVASVARIASVAPVAQTATIAHVAPVAAVATVARVATVAQVASVGAAPSGELEPSATLLEQAPRTTSRAPSSSDGASLASVPNALAGDVTGARSQRHEGESRRERERGDALIAALDARSGRDDAALARSLMGGEANGTTATSAGTLADSVAGLSRTDATERIARVLKMQEAAGDRPLSSVLLRLDAPGGGEDRIRIGLRGTSVGASFDVSDPRAADNLRTHTRELQQALERQGLEGDSLVVRTTQRTTEPASLASAVSAEREAGRIGSTAASDGGGSTARDSRNQPRADDWREGASHHRSRQQRQGGKDTR